MIFLNLTLHRIGSCDGKIDFVDYGDNFKVLIDGKICICQRLGFNSLGGIDY